MYLYFIIIVVLFILYTKYKKTHSQFLYNLKRKKKYNINLKHDIFRDNYCQNKIHNKNYDVIVIGSGLGSLSTAACLSKFGKKVLVLEKHQVPGGTCHVFSNQGYEFNTGIQYVGADIEHQQFLKNILYTPVIWESIGIGKYIYDKVFIDKIHVDFSSNLEQSINNMCKIFRKEEGVIRKYFDLVVKVSSLSNFMKFKIIRNTYIRKTLSYFLCKEYYYYASRNTYEVLLELTENEKLISTLCSQFGNLGMTPQKSSFFAHACFVNKYLRGALYPQGGPSTIVNSLIETIYYHGGSVLVNQGVSKIIIKNNETQGVEMENGDIIYCNTVVSGTGYKNTYQKLLPSKVLLNSDVTNTLLSISPSNSLIIVFLGLRGNPNILRLPKYNIWNWNHYDYEKVTQKLLYKPLESTASGLLSFPCTRDSTWENRFPGKCNAILITPISYQLFKKWKNTKNGNRGNEYNDFKNSLGEKMIQEIFLRHFPDLKNNIEYIKVNTPLTNSYYSNTSYGEFYGLEHTPERFTSHNLSTYTPYKGLYLTGQDITISGFLGSLQGGLICSNAVLNYGLPSLFFGNTLVDDLQIINDFK